MGSDSTLVVQTVCVRSPWEREKKTTSLLSAISWWHLESSPAFTPVCGPRSSLPPPLSCSTWAQVQLDPSSCTLTPSPQGRVVLLISLDHLIPARGLNDFLNADKTQNSTSSFDQSFLLQNHPFNCLTGAPVFPCGKKNEQTTHKSYKSLSGSPLQTMNVNHVCVSRGHTLLSCQCLSGFLHPCIPLFCPYFPHEFCVSTLNSKCLKRTHPCTVKNYFYI